MGDPVEDEGEDARLRGRHHFFIKIVFNDNGDSGGMTKNIDFLHFCQEYLLYKVHIKTFLDLFNALQCLKNTKLGVCLARCYMSRCLTSS